MYTTCTYTCGLQAACACTYTYITYASRARARARAVYSSTRLLHSASRDIDAAARLPLSQDSEAAALLAHMRAGLHDAVL